MERRVFAFGLSALLGCDVATTAARRCETTAIQRPGLISTHDSIDLFDQCGSQRECESCRNKCRRYRKSQKIRKKRKSALTSSRVTKQKHYYYNYAIKVINKWQNLRNRKAQCFKSLYSMIQEWRFVYKIMRSESQPAPNVQVIAITESSLSAPRRDCRSSQDDGNESLSALSSEVAALLLPDPQNVSLERAVFFGV